MFLRRASPCYYSHRHLRTLAHAHLTDRPDFEFYPDFYTPHEQRILLRAALHKLDSQESPKYRRKRREYLRTLSQPTTTSATVPPHSAFLPDKYYDFEDACFSRVDCSAA